MILVVAIWIKNKAVIWAYQLNATETPSSHEYSAYMLYLYLSYYFRTSACNSDKKSLNTVIYANIKLVSLHWPHVFNY